MNNSNILELSLFSYLVLNKHWDQDKLGLEQVKTQYYKNWTTRRLDFDCSLVVPNPLTSIN